jgi:L-asparagine transporter-like permease
MKSHDIVKQQVEHIQKKKVAKGKTYRLAWWNLSLVGIGSTIGAGFFLGSGLAIKTAGPSVLLLYLYSGITAILVFSALAEMTVNDPEEGSFQTYAKKAFGPIMGFMSGWMYWTSGTLIISSEITALSLFTQFWFPHIPLWLFSIMYTLLGLAIILFGVKNFGKIESLFASVKLATLVIFILFSALLLLGLIPMHIPAETSHATVVPFFEKSFLTLWSSLVFVMFSFGGIAVMAVASNELRNREDVTKSGIVMLTSLVTIYIVSVYLVMELIPWKTISDNESPFVTALKGLSIPYIDSAFNIIIITAAFSTMVGALYSISRIVVTLAEGHDAPSLFKKKNKKGVPVGALILNGSGIAIAVMVSYFLPDTVYEYLVTAAGLMLILNWITILTSQIKNRSKYKDSKKYKVPLYPFSSYLGILLIVITIAGCFIHKSGRIGLFISLGLLCVILIGYWIKHILRK